MLSLDGLMGQGQGKITIFENFRAQAETALTDKLIICIPDMHLLERGPNDDFLDRNLYHEKRFMELLDFLVQLKESEQDGLEIIQLGDLYDLWQARGNTSLIQAAYPNILGLIDETLRSVYVVGNHDIDLVQWYKDRGETFDRHWRYFTVTANRCTVIYEHGFQADFFNNQASWSGVFGKEITKIVGMLEYLDPEIDVMLGGSWESISRVFSMYNTGLTPRKNPENFNQHEYFNYYLDLMEKYNRGDTDDHHDPTDLSLAVIGHTHAARLVKKPKNEKFYYMMDCGSWVNGGHEFGVISGSDMAICQWG
jgi:UDP-2,3-diacylglucosamine pyrophosphatase LpxH